MIEGCSFNYSFWRLVTTETGHHRASMLVRMECTAFCWYTRWKVMVIQQQLQVTSFVACLRRSHVVGRKQYITNMWSCTIGKVKQRSLDFYLFKSEFSSSRAHNICTVPPMLVRALPVLK